VTICIKIMEIFCRYQLVTRQFSRLFSVDINWSVVWR